MGNEEAIAQELINKFNFLRDKVKVQRQRRIYADVELSNFKDVFNYAVQDLAFTMLCTITGIDEGQNIAFIYHLGKEDGTILNLKTSAPKDNPIIQTVTGLFPSADIYERELVDLLGVKVEGLAAGKRYPLPDNWPAGEYPLRKDWKAKKGDKDA